MEELKELARKRAKAQGGLIRALYPAVYRRFVKDGGWLRAGSPVAAQYRALLALAETGMWIR